MLPLLYIDNLVKVKLDDDVNGSDRLSLLKTIVAINREGDQVLIAHQADHAVYPNTVYVYRKESVWVLEYFYPIVPPDWLTQYVIDAWFNTIDQGFVIKLCNTGDSREGVTYHFRLDVDEYKLHTTQNSRVVYQEQPYYLEGVF